MTKWLKLAPIFLSGFITIVALLLKGQRNQAERERDVLRDKLGAQNKKAKKETEIHNNRKEVQDESQDVLEEQSEARANGTRPDDFGDRRLRDR